MRISSGTDQIEPESFVSIELSGEGYLVPVTHVREILDVPEIAQSPGAAADLVGLIDVRGETISVLDLRGRLGLPRVAQGGDARILVLEPDRGDADARPLGVVADRVLDVLAIGDDAFEAPPRSAQAGGLVRRLTRIRGRIAFVLDVATAVFGGPSDRMAPFGPAGDDAGGVEIRLD